MKKILFIIIALFIASCSSDEIIINNFEQGIKILTLQNDALPKISLHDFTNTKIIEEDVYRANNTKELSGKIDKIAHFRGDLFILQSEVNMMRIIDADDFTEKYELFFDSELANFKAKDICFPNATDAYILGANQVMLFDLTVYQPASVIELPYQATSINCIGNQVFIVHKEDNAVTFIDTRTRGISGTINLSPKPIAIEVLPSGEEIAVLCEGYGKSDALEASDAIIDIIDIFTQSVTSQIILNIGNISAKEIFPHNFAATSDERLFVAAKDIFLKVDLKSNGAVSFITRNNYYNLTYDFINDVLFAHENNESSTMIYSLDSFSGSRNDSYEINGIIDYFIKY